jgi:transcriptional regulator with XRE-family HTH domain
MIVGERLRILRESKNLSQGDIQKRTGLMRCYISRVENGHTVPAVETLYKFARALEIPMYRLFYEDSDVPGIPNLASAAKLDDDDRAQPATAAEHGSAHVQGQAPHRRRPLWARPQEARLS